MISKGFSYAFLGALAWSGAILCTRLVLQSGENLYNVIFWAVLFSFPFWLLRFTRHTSELKALTKKDYLILLAMTLVSTLGASLVEFFALKYTPAVNYSFLIRTVIPFTFIFAFFVLGEKFTFKKIFIASVLLIGAYLLATNGKALSLSLGDFLTIFEAMLIALGNNTLGKLASSRMSTGLNTSAIFLIGFLPAIVIMSIFGTIHWPQSILFIVLIALCNILLAQFRFTAYKNTSAAVVTMVFSFTPVFVSLLAIPFLGESLSVIQIVGGVLIVAGGVLVEALKV